MQYRLRNKEFIAIAHLLLDQLERINVILLLLPLLTISRAVDPIGRHDYHLPSELHEWVLCSFLFLLEVVQILFYLNELHA